MTRLKFGTIEMLTKVAGFGKTYASRIPAGSLALAAFDTIDATCSTISTLGALPRRKGVHPGTEVRGDARQTLRADLDTVHQTMLAVAIDHPGIEANFRLPRNPHQDQALIRAAQEFVRYATPLKDAFVAHQLPANFLDRLTSEIEALQEAINAQAQAKSERRAASQTLDDAVDQASVALQRLDALIPNMFGDDTEIISAWTVARQIQKPPRRKRNTLTPVSHTDASTSSEPSPADMSPQLAVEEQRPTAPPA